VNASENHGLYRVSVFDAFANIYCDQMAPGDSACDFHLATIVIAECDSGKVDTVISHNRNIGIAVPEYQGVVENGYCIFGRRNVEHNGGIHARIQAGKKNIRSFAAAT
jgi:hypothetical protein